MKFIFREQHSLFEITIFGAIRATDGECRCLEMSYCQTNKKPLLMNTLETEKRRPKFVSIKKVLVAVDLSEQSEATATYAAELAKCFGASLTLVHVHDPVPLYEYASETTCTVLDEQREDLQKLPIGLPGRRSRRANFSSGQRNRCGLDRYRQPAVHVSRIPVGSA
jgi:hypothetical protein